MNFKVIIFVFSLVTVTQCYNILLLAPFPGPSHWLMLKLYIKELVHRGHHVTAITAIQYKDKLQNYTEVYIDPPFNFESIWSVEDIFNKAKSSDFDNVDAYFMLGTTFTRYALENQFVKNFLKRNDLKFDLILSEQFFQESFLALSYKYNAPVVTLSTFGHADTMDRAMGYLTPWSFVPHHLIMDRGDDMSFFDRLYNVALSAYDLFKRHFYLADNQKIIDELIQPHVDVKIPSIHELVKQISLTLINNNLALSTPRPMMPGLINIAGAHIKPLQPLPADLQTILDNAKDGVIYFSLGAFMQSSKMPRDKVKDILTAFSKLKQVVLWKYEDDNILDLPKNVIVRKWMPQSDILAHKNTKLFISHGGLFGTTEGVYNGVPILFIPFYTDQFRNARQCIKKGFAKQLQFTTITSEALHNSINELVSDKSYSENAKRTSLIFRDNINDPMEQSMFWIEYVIRHKGAPHLKSAAVKMCWVQYLLLDIVAFLILIPVVFVIVLKKIFGLCCKSKQTVANNQNKQKKRN